MKELTAQERKDAPVVTGVLDYFPLALMAVANVSKVANDQHNPGQPMHWAKEKSTDHADCIGRHLIDRGTLDTDGLRHSAKIAWRSLALLQTEIENDNHPSSEPATHHTLWPEGATGGLDADPCSDSDGQQAFSFMADLPSLRTNNAAWGERYPEPPVHNPEILREV